jgi:3-dehydroquinate dehydratase type I
VSTRVILSSHDFQKTPPRAELHARAAAMREAGADIVKIAAMANDITDAAAVLSLLQEKTGACVSLTCALLPCMLLPCMLLLLRAAPHVACFSFV